MKVVTIADRLLFCTAIAAPYDSSDRNDCFCRTNDALSEIELER